jgi:hypothetical protein
MMPMLSPVYSPWGLAVERAEGMKVYTDRGGFLDAFSGIGVLPLGHSHPDVVRAVAEKAARFTHLSNYFLDPDAVTVAEQLVAMTGRPGEVYFSNSGAEANEAALKAVKKHRKGVIVSFEGNFHGRTLGALSVTWGPSMRKPFDPLVPGGVFLPLRGSMLLDFAEEYDVAAVFLECVQGNSGVIPIPGGLADAVKVLQRNKGVLVVADEIQAGLGRTGKYFSHEHWGWPRNHHHRQGSAGASPRCGRLLRMVSLRFRRPRIHLRPQSCFPGGRETVLSILLLNLSVKSPARANASADVSQNCHGQGRWGKRLMSGRHGRRRRSEAPGLRKRGASQRGGGSRPVPALPRRHRR